MNKNRRQRNKTSTVTKFRREELLKELEKKEMVIQELQNAYSSTLHAYEKILNSYSWKFIASLRKLLGIKHPPRTFNLSFELPPANVLKVRKKRTKSLRLDRITEVPFENRLSNLTIPCTLGEKNRIIDNFRIWDTIHHPIISEDINPPSLVVLCNGDPNEEFENDIEQAFKLRNMSRFFSSIEFLYCRLHGESDVYVEEAADFLKYPQGTKAGPNNQFFIGMRKLYKLNGFTFFMETDCTPIKNGWLEQLMNLVSQSESFWIKGSVYRGVSPMDDRFKTHINGNAIYASGDYQFQTFLENELHPYLMDKITNGCPWLAYDCAIDFYMNEASTYTDIGKWKKLQNIRHLITYTDYIRNYSGDTEKKNKLKGYNSNEMPNTYIIHG